MANNKTDPTASPAASTPAPAPAVQLTPQQQLENATRPDGVLAIHPRGHLVLLRPNAVRLVADVESGPSIVGLKDQWRLATPEDCRHFAALEDCRSKPSERKKKTGA